MKRPFGGLFAAAMVVTACSSTPGPADRASAVPAAAASAMPTPTATPLPTVAPTPIPTLAVSEDDLIGACSGIPIPAAGAYTGRIHPMALVVKGFDDGALWTVQTADVQPEWTAGAWSGPLLVVCIEENLVQLNTCGRYTRSSDGVSGDVLIMGDVDTVKVVVAQTGKTLKSKDFNSAEPTSCDPSFVNYGNLNGSPPWKISTYQTPSLDEEAAYFMAAGTR